MYMDCDFTKAILKTDYSSVRDIRLEYDVFLENSGLHWFIMVRPKDGQLLPYIVFEITTNSVDEGDIIPAMRVIPNPFGDADLTKSHIAYLRKSTSSLSMRITQWLGLSSDDRTLPEVMLEFAGFKAHIVGTVDMKMIEFCRISKLIVEKMAKKKYLLRTNNCQHFCNMFLHEIDLKEELTTLGAKDELKSIFGRHATDKLQFKG